MPHPVRIGIVGLGFGAEFIPIYQQHPDSVMLALCQRNEARLNDVAKAFGVERAYTSFSNLIADPDVDAVHINSPIPDHAPMTLAALAAGKHVACTVPMATSISDCLSIVSAARRAKKTYMMMETAVYTREFLFAKQMKAQGELGRIQFLRGAHQQEMAGWPGYWEGLPPMWYATHAVSPLLALAEARAQRVTCFGSGRIDSALQARYGSPFAVETALVQLKDCEAACEITRSLFETSRQYVESFDVYGSLGSFEWPQLEGELPIVFRGEKPERVDVGDFAHLLPEPVRGFTQKGVYDSDANVHLSFTQGSGHGGSHPHMAHEFLRAVRDQRPSAVDAETAANWTMVGLCAHESAMSGGASVLVPEASS